MGFFSNLFSKEGTAPAIEKRAGVNTNVGGYEAAAYTRDRSQIYLPSETEQTNPAPYARRTILAITRYLVANFPLTERICTVAESYGIGAGLVANAATLDKAANPLITLGFENWANNAFASSNQQYSLYQMEKIIARELLIAGEIFIILEKSTTDYPQLRLVPSENVRHSGKREDTTIDGLYVDTFGKVSAFQFWNGAGYEKRDASDVVHIIRHKRIGQLRGEGSFAASLNSMRDHKDCVYLEKLAVKYQTMFAAVVERAGGEAGNGDFGSAAGGTDYNTAPTQILPNVALETAFGGKTVYLEKGEKVNLMKSDRSTEGFLRFLELLHRDVCLNISLPYEFLVNAEKLTGTAVRFALSDASFFFRDLQDRIIDGGLQRIYAWVVASFIKQGRVPMPSNGMPWLVSWTRPISVNVDNTRVSNAEISLLQNSLLTFETYYSARGKDWQAEITQRVEEEVFLDKLSQETGLPIARLRSIAAGSAPAPDSTATAHEPTPQAA